MWVTRSSDWHNSSTKLEKFLVERIIQRCDYEEIISKKHRTINGFTQLKELIKLAELSKKRIRTLRTLSAIIKEAKSIHIRQNIVNDIIIGYYFQDLKKYIYGFNEEESFKNDSLDKIDSFIHNLKKFALQAEKQYFNNIIIEFKKINFSETNKIDRETHRISELVDVLIPYLLHKGYSVNTLNEVLRKWVANKYQIDLDKFFNFFNHSEQYYELIIHVGNNQQELADLKRIIYSSGEGDIRKASEFKDYFLQTKVLSPRDEVIYFNCYIKDPVSFIRNKYDEFLKHTVISKDRRSLSIFTYFFKNSYWRKVNVPNNLNFKNIKIDGDPISVISRKSTLFLSLSGNFKKGKDEKEYTLEFIKNEQLKKSIYYYNLALGSKSIENSLSLLWTSIESVLPYRIHKSDIENIKDVFSKVFSFGALTRDIQYLIKRILTVNTINQGCFNTMGLQSLPKKNSGEDLFIWLNWLKNDHENKLSQFNAISCLLANEYISTIKPLIQGNLKDLLKRLNSSKESIQFQLQRIYLHRNQIVHSGDYINEYTNLWMHLEWYIGKILYYSIRETEVANNYSSIEDLFRNLESDFEYCYSYIEKNPNKPCCDSDRIINLLLKVDWQ